MNDDTAWPFSIQVNYDKVETAPSQHTKKQQRTPRHIAEMESRLHNIHLGLGTGHSHHSHHGDHSPYKEDEDHDDLSEFALDVDAFAGLTNTNSTPRSVVSRNSQGQDKRGGRKGGNSSSPIGVPAGRPLGGWGLVSKSRDNMESGLGLGVGGTEIRRPLSGRRGSVGSGSKMVSFFFFSFEFFCLPQDLNSHLHFFLFLTQYNNSQHPRNL